MTEESVWKRRMRPQFLIIGGQRCGTTSLFRYLEQHPSFVKPRTKEIHYFTRFFEKGDSWYAKQFPRDGRSLLGAHRKDGGRMTAEASPAYLYSVRTPERCHALLPDTKLVAILRDPVERAYSHFRHSVREGYESLEFEAALKQESSRIDGEKDRELTDTAYVSEALRKFSYMDRGLYSEQIGRWLQHYNREELLLLRSEDLFEQPSRTFARLLEFVGLRPWAPAVFEVHNATKNASKIPADLRAEMRRHFEASNAELADRYGDELQWSD